MQLRSPAFLPNQEIPEEYTCQGKGGNPPLEISNVPAEAKTLAITMHDPDAPNGTYIHWLVWNIDPHITAIKASAPLANYVAGTTSAKSGSYTPPCPPSQTGSHHYIFTMFALDTVLALQEGADYPALQQAINGHIIDQCELVGLFGR